mmetsp:Transcript_21015/g.37969  ORF Transcript_21015/g.37969 Transcript_21015/m.37969 type:complete len:151 (+) Transcript_21015:186-638(+)
MLQTMHRVVSNFINEALVKFSLQEFDKDAIWAVIIGIVLGLVVLSILAAFPGEPLDIVYGESSEKENMRPSAAVNDEKIPNLHGTKSSQSQMENNESISIFQILNILVYLFLFLGIMYFLNRDYDNIATKWFVRTFPSEAATLGLHHVEL